MPGFVRSTPWPGGRVLREPNRCVVVQLLSLVHFLAIPWTAARQVSLSFILSQSLLKLMFIESIKPSNHLILCWPLFLLPSVFPKIRSFPVSQLLASGSQKYWNFSFSISPSHEYSGLICSRIDWFDFLAVQVTLKSLLQNHSLKASVLWPST